MNESCEKCSYIQNLKDDVKEHKGILDKHEVDITELKTDSREYKTEIKNLCERMENLIGTIKWVLGIFVTVAIFIIGTFLIKG